ncbi:MULTISPECIES: ATP-binding protein [unclassified Streptomyces]|uniref:ATP-binding protein n=1 Tax=unclassified Streptomyces TaxID=2593676 RepID=UPI002258D5EF|nr:MULTISPECIES: bifunctional GNAT family N-acetyltransferase/ATP-binding protein [unclassified Streptomyces]MCX4409277.1 bifunctional GNAT family N-acetyltransferase/ATP-binding protein [Streptomyces sp. NBC_01764]MCX5185197.1 bifunctional GNAT family N-acetyltransferase/ATP-binding protein [Streptomyces sp. NBC_00268]
MPTWRLRDFRDDDLDRAIQIWDQDRQTDDSPPVFPVSEVMAVARAGGPAVVAVVGDDLVGMAVAQAQDERAWITLVALAGHWRSRGIGSALIAELERRLRTQGIRRIGALLAPGATGTAALENSGYRARGGLVFYEKVEHLGASDAGLLAELGGRVQPGGLWTALAGMEREKDTIERRIVLPLAEPALADRYGVTPPKAVILFGPPGTGKTSFARAVASRLEWPFVELFPSRLAAGSAGGLAASLRDTFHELAGLETVLLFIDEVEEIAGVRSGVAVDPGHGVTNELLKLIPGFRDHDDRLLICATNSVRSLDPAFLRPGRFDYVIPVGPPDEAAREAIWRRYLGRAADGVGLHRLVEASEMFTPADIEFAARKGAQAAFEREITDRRGTPADTEDYLAAIADTRPSLTEQALTEFREDIERHVRM